MGYSTQNVSFGDSSLVLTVNVTNNITELSRSTVYFDSNGNIIGNKFETFSDSIYENDTTVVPETLVFKLQNTVSDNGVVSGFQVIEQFKESSSAPLKETFREYGVDGDTGGRGDLIGGTETLDGVSVTINADGTRQSGVVSDLSSFEQTGTAFDALEIPDAFKLDTDNDGTADAAYVKVVKDALAQGGPKETAYFDTAGKIIGKSFETANASSKESVTVFEAIDQSTDAVTWLGDLRISYAADGTTPELKEIRYSSQSTDDVVYTDATGAAQTYSGASRTEIYENYTYDATSSSWTLTLNEENVFSDPDGTHLKGTETRDGVTTEYGSGWTTLSQAVDVSGLGSSVRANQLTISADLSQTAETVFGVTANSKVYVKEEVAPWDANSKEITYIAEDGSVIGYANTYSYDDGLGYTSGGTSYFSADWNWLGDVSSSSSDTYGSWDSTRFNTENADGSRTEIGLESDGTFTRQFEFNFDADGDFTGGTETENGVTYALDANWNRKVSVEIDNLTAVTDGIDDIPAVLKADTDGDGTVDAVYQQVLRDDSDQQYGGKETAYFDATGNMLGKSFEFKDVWSGEQITSFETIDANGMHEWAGDVRVRFENDEAVSKEVFSYVEVNSSDTPLDYTDSDGATQSYTGTYRVEVSKEYTSTDDGVTWASSSSREFYFDNDWNLLKGTETDESGSTREYGQNWELKGESFETGDLTAVAAEAIIISAALNQTAATVFGVVEGSNIYVKEEVAPWDENSKEITYIAEDGKVIGYANTYSYDDGQGYTSGGTSYFSADWNWLGDVSSSSGAYGSWDSTRFNTENADGSRTEIGLESDGTFTREFEWNFDAGENFTGGTETENGVTYALDANWNRKVSVEIDNLTAVTDGIDDIPAALKADTDGDGTVDAVYQQVLRDDSDQPYGGKETAYFDATGNMLGKSFEFQDMWSGEQITSFETIDAYGMHEWAGDVRVRFDGDGKAVSKEVFSSVEVNSSDTPLDYTDSDGATQSYTGTYRVEVSKEYTSTDDGVTWASASSREFYFDSDWNLLKGTETDESGSTREYGQSWELKGESFETGDLTAVVAETIIVSAALNQTAATVFGVTANSDVFVKEVVTPWDDNSKEITYIGQDGKVIGYANSYSYSDDGEPIESIGIGAQEPATVSGFSSSGITYFSADWDWLGDVSSSSSDTYGSWDSARFNTESADGSRTEIGLESDGTFTRQFEFNFDADGNFTGGTETENGVTYALDANWNRKVSVEIDNLTAVTDGIDDIPAVLKADTDGDGTVDAVYQQILRDDSDQPYGGKETAYFDATGNMLGKSFEFQDMWSGEQITSFETIDAYGMHEWAGDVRVRFDGDGKAVSKEVFSSVEVNSSDTPLDYTDSDGATQSYTGTYRVEVSKEYTSTDDGVTWASASSREFYFDNDWNLLKGTETDESGSTREYGQSWALKGETFETGGLDVKAANAVVLIESLNLSVADFLGIADATQVYQKTTVAEWDPNSTETYYLNGEGEVLLKASGWSYSDAGNTSTSITFSTADGDWLGNDYSSSYTESGVTNYWSNAYVEIQTNWDGQGGYTEYSFDSDRAPDQVTGGFEAKRIFNFDANGNLKNGVETENGVDYKIDANFGRSVFVDVTELDQFKKSDSDLAAEGIASPPESFFFGSKTPVVTSGEQFFVREVSDGDDSSIVYEIVVKPGANLDNLDFVLSDSAGLTNFQLSDAFASGWMAVSNETDTNEITVAAISSDFTGALHIKANQETVLASFTSTTSPNVKITDIVLNATPVTDGVSMSIGGYYIQLIREDNIMGNKEYSFMDDTGAQIGKAFVWTDGNYESWNFDAVDSEGNFHWVGGTDLQYVVDVAGVRTFETKNERGYEDLTSTSDEPLTYTQDGMSKDYVGDYSRDTNSDYSWNVTDQTWVLEASRDFYFDDNGNLLKGSELRDGVTTNYGFGWDIEGETVEVGDLSAVKAGAVDLDGGVVLNQTIATVFGVAADSDVYVKEDVTPWDQNSKEITYIGADNSVIGYANTYSYVDGQGSSSGTSYFSADWNWLGDVSSSSSWTSARFNTEKADGSRTEIGLESDGTFTRQFQYNFDADEYFTGGTETENGVTYALDENWMRSVFVDPTKLSEFAETADSLEVAGIPLPPEVLGVDTDGSPGVDVYYIQVTREDNNMGNKEYSFMDDTGAQIGKAFVWTDGNYESWNFDAVDSEGNFHWVGGTDLQYVVDVAGVRTFETKNERGYEDLTSTSDEPLTYTQDGMSKDYVGDYSRDTNSDYSWNVTDQTWVLEASRDFYFDDNGNLLKGSELRDGVTTNYGFGWDIEGETVEVGDLSAVKAGAVDLDGGEVLNQTIATVFGVEDTSDVYVKEVVTPWDQNSKEITYIGADNSVIGYANTYSYVDGQGSSSGTSYFSADWNWLGDVSSSSSWTSARFNTEKADGSRTEIGLESDGTFTRQFQYNFDADEYFTGGTETENGVTYALDENWNRKVSVDIDNLTAVTAGINDIPAVLKADTNDDGTVDAVYRTVIRDESSDGGPVEMAYFDDDGNMLGKSFQETYDMGEITEQFTNFETIDASGMHEWAGNVRIRFEADGSTPNFKEVRSAVEFDGSVTPLAYTNEYGDAASFTGMYRFEDDKEFSTSNGGVTWGVETSREFYYDIDSGGYWTLLKGTETSSDGSSYEYGYDYEVLGVSVKIPDDAIDIDPTDVDVEPGLGVKLSDIYAFGDDETSAKKSADFTPSENNNRGTENYFTIDGKLIGFKEVFDYSIGANTGPRGAEYFDSEGEYIGRVEYFDHDNDDTTSDVVRFVDLNIEVNETTSREIEIFQNNSGIKYVEDVLFTAQSDGSIVVVASAQDIDTNNNDEVVFWEKINSNVTVNDDRDLLTFEGTYIDVLAGIQITLSGVDAVTGEPVATLLTEYTGSGSPDENGESSFFDIMPVNNIGVDPSYMAATGLSADNIRAAVYWEIFGEKLNDDFEYPDVEPTPVRNQDGNLVGVEFAGAKYALQLLGNITPVMSEDGLKIIGFGGTAIEVKPLLIEGRPQGENDVTIGGSAGLTIDVAALFDLMSDGPDDAVNAAPKLTDSQTDLPDGLEDTTYTVSIADLLVGFTDIDKDSLTVKTVTTSNGAVTLNGDGTAYVVTPETDYNGPVTLTYTVTDENGGDVTGVTQTFDLIPVNDMPTGSPDVSLPDGLEDTTYTVSIADLLVGFTDIDKDSLTVKTVTTSNGAVTLNGDGTAYVVTPDTDYNGPVTLTYTVTDENGGDVTGVTQTFNVDPADDGNESLPDVSEVSVLTSDGSVVDIDAAQNKLEWQLDSANPQANGTFKLEKSDPLFSLFGLNAADVPEDYNAQKISIKIGDPVDTIGIDPIINKITFTIIQDLDGDGSDDAGERSITASFDIERTGDGQQETWEAKAGGQVVLTFKGQSGTTADVTLTNQDSDQMVFDDANSGTIVPDSWVSKLSDAKSIIESDSAFSGLSFPSMQSGDEYIVKMTVSDETMNVSQELLSIDIDVIDDMPDISTVSVIGDNGAVQLDADGNDLQWELDVPPTDEGTITLESSDPLFSLFGLNGTDLAGNYQQKLLVEIGDAVDTGDSGPIVNSLVLEIIQDLDRNGSYDDGERSITASFDIERTGDGQQETWEAKAGEDVTFNFTGQSGTTAKMTLQNLDSDQMVFDDTNDGTFVPDSWMSKLSSAKSIIESDPLFGDLSFPNVQAGDNYIVKLSVLDDNNDVSVDILSLDVDILILGSDIV